MRMITRLTVVAVALAGFVGFTACSENTVTAEDAYQIGCPAVDAAVVGGGVVGRATLWAEEAE